MPLYVFSRRILSVDGKEVKWERACKTRRRVDCESASWILEAVPIDKAFLFFKDVGEYTGKLASSLEDFLAKMNVIPLRSLEFHLGRPDFQK